MSLDYEQYMLSEEWAAVKRNHPAPKMCIACESRQKVELHHMHYPADLWQTTWRDCCWLCERCHNCFHRGLVNGRAQGYRLDGRCEAFTKDVIRVQQKFELTASAGEVLLMGRSKGRPGWGGRGNERANSAKL